MLDTRSAVSSCVIRHRSESDLKSSAGVSCSCHATLKDTCYLPLPTRQKKPTRSQIWGLNWGCICKNSIFTLRERPLHWEM